ncbi:hypothetical protein MIND_00942900 [Mycena indigotica]|uniref:Uncharacterized protein n=1 Tax=Mycena indigotica TaxID=2126181 RepID=A0A8H6SFW5_9AGAR|nr:uncharacterized protein MIND_00942900 [Mycena indigotica]KAF7297100.1 hypothetical protein MIND_00942900 [Mycena indigotica]
MQVLCVFSCDVLSLNLTIPFNGTGITLCVAIDYGDIYNTSISLDGRAAENHFAYNQPNIEAYNFTLYNIQNLTWTTHTLVVALEPGVSRLLFDYAAVTGDAPSGQRARKNDEKSNSFSLWLVMSILALNWAFC